MHRRFYNFLFFIETSAKRNCAVYVQSFFYRNTKGLIFLVLVCEQKKRLQKNKGGNKQERIKTDMIHRSNL